MMVFILVTRAMMNNQQSKGKMRKGRAARPLPVCDCEDGLVLKFLPDGLLQEFVRLLVHAGRGLINTQELHGGQPEVSVSQNVCFSDQFGIYLF